MVPAHFYPSHAGTCTQISWITFILFYWDFIEDGYPTRAHVFNNSVKALNRFPPILFSIQYFHDGNQLPLKSIWYYCVHKLRAIGHNTYSDHISRWVNIDIILLLLNNYIYFTFLVKTFILFQHIYGLKEFYNYLWMWAGSRVVLYTSPWVISRGGQRVYDFNHAGFIHSSNDRCLCLPIYYFYFLVE